MNTKIKTTMMVLITAMLIGMAPMAGMAGELRGTLNINTAQIEDLNKLPEINKSLAANIVEYRTINGNFTDISDIVSIEGMSYRKADAIKGYIKYDGASDLRVDMAMDNIHRHAQMMAH